MCVGGVGRSFSYSRKIQRVTDGTLALVHQAAAERKARAESRAIAGQTREGREFR